MGYQMYFANKAIDACTHISLNLKYRLKETKIHKLMGSLEVFAIIPFNYTVLELANSMCITEDF